MNRLTLVDAASAPLASAPYFQDGDPGAIVAALAQVPELLAPTIGFIGAALGPGAASTRHKEMAILRTSAVQGCRYCVQAHTVVARDAGLTVEEVGVLRDQELAADGFADAAEQGLLTWIDAMARTGAVPDGVWDDARAFWPEHILIELSVTIGATILLNRFATGFEIPTAPNVLDRLDADGWA